MKAITIIQPFATLIVICAKQLETRSWPTKYRGPIAIHAGKKIDREACEREPIRSTLAAHGYTADNLPTGAIVATCELRNCWHIGRFDDGRVKLGDLGLYWITSDSKEYRFGDYTVGRWAWRLEHVQKLEPIPAIGRQGLWNWVTEEQTK